MLAPKIAREAREAGLPSYSSENAPTPCLFRSRKAVDQPLGLVQEGRSPHLEANTSQYGPHKEPGRLLPVVGEIPLGLGSLMRHPCPTLRGEGKRAMPLRVTSVSVLAKTEQPRASAGASRLKGGRRHVRTTSDTVWHCPLHSRPDSRRAGVAEGLLQFSLSRIRYVRPFATGCAVFLFELIPLSIVIGGWNGLQHGLHLMARLAVE